MTALLEVSNDPEFFLRERLEVFNVDESFS